MLKWLAIFGVMLIVFCADCSANKIQNKDDHKQPASPVAAVSPQQQGGAKSNGGDQQDIHADVKIVNPPEKDLYDKAPVWINIALAIVGAVGIGIGVKTIRTIKRQADLQEAALQQWLEIAIYGSDPSRELRDGLGFIAEEAILNLRFTVKNPTNYPLKIEHVITDVGFRMGGRRLKREPFTVDAKKSIVPPGKDYPFFVPISIDRPLIERYLESGFVVYVDGIVYFEDVSRKTDQQQWFGWEANFAHDEFTTRPFQGHEPESMDKKIRRNA